ncbi:MAG: hypothetical protein J3R72DRAFT_513030 [Linnemannia gamsii]|nr:MAG: hypothetical protein J3R72DRAFT_513030 [Linnemannia gamsii]
MTKEGPPPSRQLLKGGCYSPPETPPSPEPTYVCDEEGCGKTFSTKSNLTRHKKDQHPGKIFPLSRQPVRGQSCPPPDTLPSPETTYYCDEEGCGKTFSTKGNLTRHKKERYTTGKTFLCDKKTKHGRPCTKSFKTKRDLERHIRDVHDLITCKEPHCSEVCTRENYQQHLNECHRSFPCLIGKCEHKVCNTGALSKHRKNAHGYLKSSGVPPELFIEQPKALKPPKSPAPPPPETLVPETLVPECVDEENNGKELQGERVSPMLWVDTLTALTNGQKTAYDLLTDNHTCYVRRSWEKGAAHAKERYGVDGPASVLWAHPEIQPFIDQQLQDAYCHGHNCGVNLSRVNATFFFDRDVAERIDYLLQLAKELPAGVIWGNLVLDEIENCFDEKFERNRPDVDSALRKDYHAFIRFRVDNGKEHRTRDWTFEKYRFYLEACQRRSVLTGMRPRRCCDFDRSLDTDPYDLHTVVYLEREINFMKKDFLEFKNDKEFIRSNEKSRTRWAVNILRKQLYKILDDTKELKNGLEMMKKNPLPCVNIHHTPLLEHAEKTLAMEESVSSPPVQGLTQPLTGSGYSSTCGQDTACCSSSGGATEQADPFKEIEANDQQAAVAARGQSIKMDSCSPAKIRDTDSPRVHPVAPKIFKSY